MREQSQPRLLDRRVREEWQSDGATDLYARSQAKAREIIETHVPEPLDADIVKEMRAFVAQADQERGV
jgi:Trimethylamine:corrinoid methyltransferase